MYSHKITKSYEQDKPSLYLVATPIGNLEDMTFRAVNTLKMVDIIYAEDTRVSKKLLFHYEIKDKPLYSYHTHNEQIKSTEIIRQISDGKNVAIISDAGMPIINDPGYTVVVDAIKEDIPVVVIPGVSAAITALVGSGISPYPHTFYGFLNATRGKRKKVLNEIKSYTQTLIFYESPHRIKDTLEDMLEVFGNRNIVLARELTKIHEEYRRGLIADVLSDIDTVKGEIVLIVDGNNDVESYNDISIKEHVGQYIEDGLTSKDAIKKVAKDRGIPKQDVYKEYHTE